MCDKNLNEIKELTEKLIDIIPDHNRGTMIGDSVKELKVVKGYALAYGIHIDNDNRVAVAYTEAYPNTEFEKHSHNEIEDIMVYKGKLLLTVNPGEDDEEIILLTDRNSYTIQPNTVHKGFTKDGCMIIVVTRPASKGFPRDEPTI